MKVRSHLFPCLVTGKLQTDCICAEARALVLVWRGKEAMPPVLAEVAFVLLSR